MSKITIKDLPRDLAISKEEMRRVVGGAFAVLPQGEDLYKPGSTIQISGSLLAKAWLPKYFNWGRTLYASHSYYG